MKLFLTILLSLLFAMMLAVLPLPEAFVALRPAWVLLVVIFWVMLNPHRVSLGFAWCCGLMLDVLTDTMLGMHALSFTLVAYFVAKWSVRLKLFPIWQQAWFIFLFLLLNQVFLFIPQALIGNSQVAFLYWLSPLLGMLLWPWLYLLLSGLAEHAII